MGSWYVCKLFITANRYLDPLPFLCQLLRTSRAQGTGKKNVNSNLSTGDVTIELEILVLRILMCFLSFT